MINILSYLLMHPTNYIQLYITPSEAGLPSDIDREHAPKITPTLSNFRGWLVVGFVTDNNFHLWEELQPPEAKQLIAEPLWTELDLDKAGIAAAKAGKALRDNIIGLPYHPKDIEIVIGGVTVKGFADVDATFSTPISGMFYVQYKNVTGEWGGTSPVPRDKLAARIGEGAVKDLENGTLEKKDTDFARYTWKKDKK